MNDDQNTNDPNAVGQPPVGDHPAAPAPPPPPSGSGGGFAASMISPAPTLALANEIVSQQEYLLNRQAEILRCAIARNNDLVKVMGEVQRENHRLRKELQGYKEGRWWTIISSFLPTMDLRWKDE